MKDIFHEKDGDSICCFNLRMMLRRKCYMNINGLIHSPNVISYLITPLWPNKVDSDATWEKVRDNKLYTKMISDYQDDLKSKMQEKAKENEAQRKTLEQFVPEKVDEIVPEENYEDLFDGEDLPSHEELQAEFNVDDD